MSKLSEKLRTANSVFHQLVELSQILNSIFSNSLLFLFTTSILMVTADLLFLIFDVSMEPFFGVDMSSLHIFNLLLNIGVMTIILTAADRPLAEVCFLTYFQFYDIIKGCYNVFKFVFYINFQPINR